MSCPQCGSSVAAASKFCPECGAAQPTDVTDVAGASSGTPALASSADSPMHPASASAEPVTDDPTTDVESAPTVAPTPAHAAVTTPPTEPTTASTVKPTADPVTASTPSNAKTTPAATSTEPKPHAAAVGQERQAMASFANAIVPVLRTPLVVVTALAVVLSLVISLVASTVVNALVTLIAGDDLPDGGGEWWDFAWIAHFQSHQVPLTNDDSMIAISPIIYIGIALGACWAGVQLARRIFRTTPLATEGERATAGSDAAATTAASAHARDMYDRLGVWAFAITYVIANLILAAFGPEDTGIGLFLGIVLPLAIAWAGYALAARVRLVDRPVVATGAAHGATTAPNGFLARTWRLVAIPTVVLGGMIAVAAAATLVANIIEVTTDDGIDNRPALTFDAVHMVDEGWTTVSYGMLNATKAEASSSFGDDDDDETETRSSRIWDLRDDEVSGVTGSDLQFGTLANGELNVASFIIVLIAGFGTVLLGGLYAGFRVARDTGRLGSMQSAALAGAIVGPVWAVLSIVLSLVVTDRMSIDAGSVEAMFTTAAAIEIFFLALVGGAILGAVGGLLAAQSGATSTNPKTTTPPADPTGPVPA